MIGILIPSRLRRPTLTRTLLSLVECGDPLDFDVVVLADDDPETAEMAARWSGNFGRYTVLQTKRLYAVKAFNAAFQSLAPETELFAWLADDIMVNENFAQYLDGEFWTTFPDGIGVLSLLEGVGAGLAATTTSFLEYNEDSFYHEGYVFHYADVELTHRAMMMGCFSWPDKDMIRHDKTIDSAYPNIDPARSYDIRLRDKRLFRSRRKTKFGLPKEKIKYTEPITEFRKVVI